MPSNHEEQLYTAARRHYIDGATMETIGHELGVSRPTVSRLLAKARETGLVRITLAEPPSANSPTAHELHAEFGVRVHVVPVAESVEAGPRLRAVAGRAAELLSTIVSDDTTLGVAWGVTTAQVARQLTPTHLDGVRIVQMNGAVHARDISIPTIGSLLQTFATAFGDAAVIPFPVPAFFDHASTRAAMWQERSVQRVREEISALDIAVFGIGHPSARVPSHVYSAGYIDTHELAEMLRHGVVGDVCTVMLRADGSWRDVPINARATGPTPDEMQSIARRVGVVGDPSRAVALVAALRAGTITDLVCDHVTAQAARNIGRKRC